MCGVPYHAANGYIARLVAQGFRVALCEQMEDPKTAKGVVHREVVRVITPGTQLEATALDAGETSYVLALAPGPTSLGAAWLDATTGEFFAAEWEGPGRFDRLRDEIGGTGPREILVRADAELPAWLTDPAQPEGAIPRAPAEDRSFEPGRGRRELLAHFGVVSLEAFGCEELPAGSGRRRSRPALRARDAEARPHPRDGPHHAGRRRRPGHRLGHPAQPRAHREHGRRQPTRHAPRRSRPHPNAHGSPPPAGLDPQAPGRARANPGPPRRGRGARLPGPRPGAPPRGPRRGAGPRSHRGPGDAGHRRSRATWWPSPGRSERFPRRPRPWTTARRPWSGSWSRSWIPRWTWRRTWSATWWTSPRRSCAKGASIRDGVDPELDELRATSRGGGRPSPRSRSASASGPGSPP